MQPQEPFNPQQPENTVPTHQAGQVFSPSGPPSGDLTSAPQPAAPSPQSPISASTMASQTPQKTPRRFMPSKKLAIILAVVLVLLGGSAAAYFGYYVPNKPENVWRTALERTGKGYDKISDSLMSAKYSQGVQYDGSFKVDAGVFKADGTLQGSSDAQTNSKTSGSISASGLKLNFDLLTVASSTSAPDLYFKIDGLQGLGDLLGGGNPEFNKTLNSVDKHWYFVDHTLLEKNQTAQKNQLSISKKDINDFLDAFGNPSKKYIFTSDPQKMAIVVKQNIGKEKQDNLDTYHYKVGVNKANLKKWNTEVCDNLKDNKLYKLMNFGQAQATIDKQCYDTSDIDKMSDSKTADAWVDLHTKLIHKIRFTDSKNVSNYVDLAQNYQGGNKIPVSLSFVDNLEGKITKGLVNIDYNTDTGGLKLTSNFNIEGESGGTGSLNFTVSPNTAPVKVEKPAGAKNILQLLSDLGFGDLSLGGEGATGSNSAKDTERKTDLNAMEGMLEVYYTDSGSYPTFANLSNASWRKTNLHGGDESAFKDPDGASAQLVAVPKAGAYAYQPKACDQTGCQSYSLTATLSDGTKYTKKSLN